MASETVKIRTTLRDLWNDFTSTELGKVKFDAQGVAEVTHEVASFLLGFGHFVDHDDSAKDAGLIPPPQATEAPAAPAQETGSGTVEAPITVEDVAKLAAMFDCELKPKGDPDWTATFSDDEIVTLAQTRGLTLAKPEEIAAEVKKQVAAALDKVRRDAAAQVKKTADAAAKAEADAQAPPAPADAADK